MVSKKTETDILKGLAIAIIAGLIISLSNSYFNSSSPVFYLDDSNNYGFNKDIEETINLNLNNRGNVEGFAILCASSREFVFKSSNNDFVHQICFPESKIYPIQTSLMQSYKLTTKPDANIFNSIQNATILIEVTCNQNIWSLFPKKCDDVTRIYNYKKDGDRLTKI
ncbi:MAG: hypothetical protein PHH85_04545 [Candidatus Methanoperedens sp.]|nr:hypothetical protein [Candidatus Methanoperedens sp.]